MDKDGLWGWLGWPRWDTRYIGFTWRMRLPQA
jgi:hypothetical protein